MRRVEAFTDGACSGNPGPGGWGAVLRLRSDGPNDGAVRELSGGEGKLLYLADGSGDFVKALGLDNDLSANGMGLRSKRFSMIVDDGTVTALNVESKPGVDASSAAHILEQL
jgi:peroxiredoxin